MAQYAVKRNGGAKEPQRFLYEIPNGLHEHDLVEIRGWTKKNARYISIELAVKDSISKGKIVSTVNRKNVPLKLRLHVGGKWEAFALTKEKERMQRGQANAEFKPGSEFLIRLISAADRFHIFLEKSYLLSFGYIVQLDQITHLQLSGEAQFDALQFEDSVPFLDEQYSSSKVVIPQEPPKVIERPRNDTDTMSESELSISSVTPEPNIKGRDRERERERERDPGLETVSISSRRSLPPDALFNETDEQKSTPVPVSVPVGVPTKSVAVAVAVATTVDNSAETWFQQALQFDKFNELKCAKERVRVRVGSHVHAHALLQSDAANFVYALSTTDQTAWTLRPHDGVTLVVFVRLLPVSAFRAFLLNGSVLTVLSDDNDTDVVDVVKQIAARDRKLTFTAQHKFRYVTLLVNDQPIVEYHFRKMFGTGTERAPFPFEKMTNLTVAGDFETDSIRFEFPQHLVVPHLDLVPIKFSETNRPQVIVHLTCDDRDREDRISFGFTQDEVDAPNLSGCALVCELDPSSGRVAVGPEAFGRATESKVTFEVALLLHLHGEHQLAFRIGSHDYQLSLDHQLIASFEHFVSPASLNYVFVKRSKFTLRDVVYTTAAITREPSPEPEPEPVQTVDEADAPMIIEELINKKQEKTVQMGKLARAKRSSRERITSGERLNELLDDDLIYLDRYTVVEEYREPSAIRVCKVANAQAKLQQNALECLFAVSTTSQKLWPLCLAGEVAIVVHVQASPGSMRAFLLYGPVCTQLAQDSSPSIFQSLHDHGVTFSVQHRYKRIVILANGLRVVDYNYSKLFDDPDHKLFFPFERINNLTIAGDLERNSVLFDFPRNLVLPYYNQIDQDIFESPNPEVQVAFTVDEYAGWMRIMFLQDDMESSNQSLSALIIEMDPTSGRICISGERFGKLTGPIESFVVPSLVELRGEHVLLFRVGPKDYKLLLNGTVIVTCKQLVPPLSLRYIQIADGDFSVQSVDFYPKLKKGNPCCLGCSIQ